MTTKQKKTETTKPSKELTKALDHLLGKSDVEKMLAKHLAKKGKSNTDKKPKKKLPADWDEKLTAKENGKAADNGIAKADLQPKTPDDAVKLHRQQMAAVLRGMVNNNEIVNNATVEHVIKVLDPPVKKKIGGVGLPTLQQFVAR